MNRGNQKARVFHSSADYAAFLEYMREAQDRPCSLVAKRLHSYGYSG